MSVVQILSRDSGMTVVTQGPAKSYFDTDATASFSNLLQSKQGSAVQDSSRFTKPLATDFKSPASFKESNPRGNEGETQRVEVEGNAIIPAVDASTRYCEDGDEVVVKVQDKQGSHVITDAVLATDGKVGDLEEVVCSETSDAISHTNVPTMPILSTKVLVGDLREDAAVSELSFASAEVVNIPQKDGSDATDDDVLQAVQHLFVQQVTLPVVTNVIVGSDKPLPQKLLGNGQLTKISTPQEMLGIEEATQEFMIPDPSRSFLSKVAVVVPQEAGVELSKSDHELQFLPQEFKGQPNQANTEVDTKEPILQENTVEPQPQVRLTKASDFTMEEVAKGIVASSNLARVSSNDDTETIVLDVAVSERHSKTRPSLANSTFEMHHNAEPTLETSKGLDDITEYTFEMTPAEEVVLETGEIIISKQEITFTKALGEEVEVLSDVEFTHKMHKETIDQVMIAVKQMKNTNAKSVIVNLHPAELGKIEIKLHVQDNNVQKIEMTAANRDTIALLQDSMAKLEAELKKVVGSEGASLEFNFKEGNQSEGREMPKTHAAHNNVRPNTTIDDGAVVSHYHVSQHSYGSNSINIRA